MAQPFIQALTFQVKPDKTEEFEALWQSIAPKLTAQQGCLSLRCFKRFYTYEGKPQGQPPRALTRIVKCVKYFAYWEFDSIDACGTATGQLFEDHVKEIDRLLLMPFEINSGYAL